MGSHQLDKKVQLTGDQLLNKKEGESLFSYQLLTRRGQDSLAYTLYQKATDYSLEIKIKAEEGVFTVTSFTLLKDQELEEKSESLYDAAILEIVLEGMKFVMDLARQARKEEINFLLSQEEYEHLHCFTSFFHSIAHRKGKVFMIFPTSVDAQDIFQIQRRLILKHIRKGLWVRQREDKFLQRYLQSNDREIFSLVNTGREERKGRENNVILFSAHSKKPLV